MSVKFVKAELGAIKAAIEFAAEAQDAKGKKLCASILAKIAAADDKPKGVSAGIMELLLVQTSRGKVVKMVTGSGYARASLVLTRLGATEQDMRDLGTWMASQGWLKGSLTINTVLAKWDEWLPRARSQAAPKGVSEGFDGAKTTDVGQVPPGWSQKAPVGRF